MNKHLKDFNDLNKVIEENKELSLKELCEKLGGENYEEYKGGKYFDVMYKDIFATIDEDENGNITQRESFITIYDENDEVIADDCTLEEIKKRGTIC